MVFIKLAPLLVILFMVLAGCAGDDSMIDPDLASARLLTIVAHQDDDLLFVNPTIQKTIRSGGTVCTVFVTAGDLYSRGGSEKYWLGREEGSRAAYAFMEENHAHWISDAPTYGGMQVNRTVLQGAKISLIFLRLADAATIDGVPSKNPPSHPSKAIAPEAFGPDLTHGWIGTSPILLYSGSHMENGPIPMLGTSGRESMSAVQLIDVLLDIMNHFKPTMVAILDGLGQAKMSKAGFHGCDHASHTASAKFAFDAHRLYPAPHQLIAHRAYNIDDLPTNLSDVEFDRKWDVFSAYTVYDPQIPCIGICSSPGRLRDVHYTGYISRQYPIPQIISGKGRLQLGTGGCLARRLGSSVAIQPCDALSPDQEWRISYQAIMSTAGNTCLEDADGMVGLATCDADDVSQRFTLAEDGTLRGAQGQCVGSDDNGEVNEVACKSAVANDAPRSVGTCGPGLNNVNSGNRTLDLNQAWTLVPLPRKQILRHCALGEEDACF